MRFKHIFLYVIFLLVGSFTTITLNNQANAADNSVPSEGCSYSLYWTTPQGGILIDNIQVSIKETRKANLVFTGSGCSSFATLLKVTSPTGNAITNSCLDVRADNLSFGASVYFDTPGTYTVNASVYFGVTDCSRRNQNKDVNISAFAQAPTVVISGEQARVTDKSATITWKTDQPADSTVWLRQKNDPNKGSKLHNSTLVKDHSMTFNNLVPATEYIYTVYGTADGGKTVAQGSDRIFMTNAAGNTTPATSGTVVPSNIPPATPAVNIPSNISVNVPDYDTETGKPLDSLIKAQSVPEFIASVMKGILLVIAVLAVIFILVGGFKMAMSQGNSESLTAAKKTVTWAILGLVVALMSYSIVAILQSLIGVQ